MICVCSQAQVDGVQDEDFTVDFLSILPDHPAFLYELNGLGNSQYKSRIVHNVKISRWLRWNFSSPCCLGLFPFTTWQQVNFGNPFY